jgi:hypothetical protein
VRLSRSQIEAALQLGQRTGKQCCRSMRTTCAKAYEALFKPCAAVSAISFQRLPH